MSFLDSEIRRLRAQRSCLSLARRLIERRPGLILELGLGRGRTFDHIRQLFPDRSVFVFERAPAVTPDRLPPPQSLIIGDLRETLGPFVAKAAQPIVLVHADLGARDPEGDAALVRWLAPVLAATVSPGGVVLSDMPLEAPALRVLRPPRYVAPGRYYLYRRAPESRPPK